MENSMEVSQLCSKRLKFEKTLKVVEKCWETGPSFICMSYVGIGYDWLERYSNKRVWYIICVDVHKIESHKCKVIEYMTKTEKIYNHVIPKYANYSRNHQVTAFKYSAKLSGQTKAYKKKIEKS